MDGQLNMLSLREQVYAYLRQQMNVGRLLPGSTINIGEIASQLGISKTPLRDALIHLEVEGFVTILPRRGVKVNVLGLMDVRNAYDAVGMVESSIIMDCFDRIKPFHIEQLEAMNVIMMTDIENNDFENLFRNNIQFHDVFINLSDNELLKKFILPIKQRLYDFPRQNYIKDWEMANCREHDRFIGYLKLGDPVRAAHILKDIHWSFETQKDYIQKFYKL